VACLVCSIPLQQPLVGGWVTGQIIIVQKDENTSFPTVYV
jgi:hypothetical protein